MSNKTTKKCSPCEAARKKRLAADKEKRDVQKNNIDIRQYLKEKYPDGESIASLSFSDKATLVEIVKANFLKRQTNEGLINFFKSVIWT